MGGKGGLVGQHPVAAGGLGAVQRRVGIGQQRLDARVVALAGSHADGDSERDGMPGRRHQPQLRDGALDALGHLAGAVGTGVGQERGKFLAPQAAEQVCLAQGLADGVCAGADGGVAHLVPMLVVDALEVVDVDHQHGARLPVAAAVVEQGRAALHEGPSVQ